MSIDLEAIRRKHAEISNPSQGGDSSFLDNFLQIQEGNNVVRILPGKDEDTPFYAETKIHRVTANDNKIRNVHCRKIHGEKCPLCDLYFSLWKTGVTDDETLARQIKPRSRYYMNVVDRESAKVKILSVGIMLFQKILNTILDEDYGDITDLSVGHDFKIIKIMEGQWPKYDQSQPRPKSSEAGKSSEIAEWMDSLHDVHGLVKLEEYDDVVNIVDEITPPSLRGTAYTDTPNVEGSDDEFLNKMQS
jgi:hypothetical protein